VALSRRLFSIENASISFNSISRPNASLYLPLSAGEVAGGGEELAKGQSFCVRVDAPRQLLHHRPDLIDVNPIDVNMLAPVGKAAQAEEEGCHVDAPNRYGAVAFGKRGLGVFDVH
jgi:hypothetical protein